MRYPKSGKLSEKPRLSVLFHICFYDILEFLHRHIFSTELSVSVTEATVLVTDRPISICSASLTAWVFLERKTARLTLFHDMCSVERYKLLFYTRPCIVKSLISIFICSPGMLFLVIIFPLL